MPQIRSLSCLLLATAGMILPERAAASDALPPVMVRGGHAVPACVTPARLTAYLKARNPALAPRFEALPALYKLHGEAAGIRWDYAVFQMIVETASLTFRRPNGSPAAVGPEQNNFAGIGASGGGVAGERFADLETGVRAHIQHIRLYGGEHVAQPIAERTRKVQAWGILAQWQRPLGRPVAWSDLARHWAAGDASYGASIQNVARRFFADGCADAHPEPPVASVTPTDERVRAPRVAAARFAAPTGVLDRSAAAESAGRALAREASERGRADPASTRAGLGAAPLAPPEPEPAPAAPTPPATVALQSVRILNATPDPVSPPPAAEAPRSENTALAPPSPEATHPEDALRTLVSGRTVILDTPLGTTIPITFNADGTARGRAGSLASYLGSPTDEGRWWVERGRLCQKWKVWFDRELQCLRFRQAGEVIHWTRDDGRTGTARLARH